MCQLCAVVVNLSLKPEQKWIRALAYKPSLYSMQIVFDQNNYNESMARLHLYQF